MGGRFEAGVEMKTMKTFLAAPLGVAMVLAPPLTATTAQESVSSSQRAELPDQAASKAEISQFRSSLSGHAASRKGMVSGSNDAYSVTVSVEPDGSVSTNVVQHAPDDGTNDWVTLEGGLQLDISEATSDDSYADLGGFASGGMVEPMRVSGCQALSNKDGWIRRANCKVFDQNAGPTIVSGTFYADYSVKTGRGRIDKVFANREQCGTGGGDSPSLYINRKYDDGAVPAQAIHSWRCKAVGLPVYRNVRHDLLVDGSAWSVIVE